MFWSIFDRGQLAWGRIWVSSPVAKVDANGCIRWLYAAEPSTGKKNWCKCCPGSVKPIPETNVVKMDRHVHRCCCKTWLFLLQKDCTGFNHCWKIQFCSLSMTIGFALSYHLRNSIFGFTCWSIWYTVVYYYLYTSLWWRDVDIPACTKN